MFVSYPTLKLITHQNDEKSGYKTESPNCKEEDPISLSTSRRDTILPYIYIINNHVERCTQPPQGPGALEGPPGAPPRGPSESLWECTPGPGLVYWSIFFAATFEKLFMYTNCTPLNTSVYILKSEIKQVQLRKQGETFA